MDREQLQAALRAMLAENPEGLLLEEACALLPDGVASRDEVNEVLMLDPEVLLVRSGGWVKYRWAS